MSSDNIFPIYEKTADGVKIVKNILIKGGAGVADKRTLLTLPSIATEISDSDFQALKEMPAFKMQVDSGFITYSQSKVSENKAVKDMTEKDDNSAPNTPTKIKSKTTAKVVNK